LNSHEGEKRDNWVDGSLTTSDETPIWFSITNSPSNQLYHTKLVVITIQLH